MKIEVDKKGWRYQLYRFGSFFSRGKGKGNYAHYEVYLRRMTLGAIYTAYFIGLHWIGWILLQGFIRVPALVFSIVTNLVTVPTGIGVCVLYPERKFLNIPFEIQWRGRHRSLAWILVPLEVVLVNLWVICTHHPIDRLVLNLVWAGTAIAVIGFVLAIKFVNTASSRIVEFVD